MCVRVSQCSTSVVQSRIGEHCGYICWKLLCVLECEIHCKPVNGSSSLK